MPEISLIYLHSGSRKRQGTRYQLELLVGVLFAAPFICFHYWAISADRSANVPDHLDEMFEVGVMLFAKHLVDPILNWRWRRSFSCGTQGALFARPRTVLPELLPQERLSWGTRPRTRELSLPGIVGA